MKGSAPLGFALLVASALPLLAQEGRLARVDSLADAGRVEEARRSLLAWMDEEMPAASGSDLEHGLWLRALLTVDPAQARIDLIRLTVEHPTGRWADRALLRLGHLARARSDAETAIRRYRTLLRDYPASEVRDRAVEGLAALGEPPDAVVGPPVPAGVVPSEGAEGDFAIQLGAFAARARADAVRTEARAEGLDARLVRIPGSELFRVRVGRFPGRETAEDELRAVRRAGFDAIVVAGAGRERSAGDRPGPS